jgi:hypothetical protein
MTGLEKSGTQGVAGWKSRTVILRRVVREEEAKAARL